MSRYSRMISILFTVSALRAGFASGADAYVVRVATDSAPVPLPPAPCGGLVYRDELIFHNAGAADATISLAGVSNGTAANPQPLTVPAGGTKASVGASSAGGDSATGTWGPDPQPLLWVAHLDVPDGVQLISRLLVLVSQPGSCSNFPENAARTYAGIPMPVVRSLVAAGVPQVHLGTDIGGASGGNTLDGRTNVGVYNGGSAPAHAVVDLRRSCDGTLISSRSATINPNTIVQLNGFSEVFDGCSDLNAAGFESHVVVTVDQPSFSYAITLSNEALPLLPVSSSP